MTAEIGGREALAGRHIVLIGMMGAGKSTVGRALARRLNLPFTDADEAIEAAAKRSITDIFAEYGEPEFRRLEREVIARLLAAPQQVIATGGGAPMDPETRARMKAHSVSVWLRVKVGTLAARTERRGKRPLLAEGDVRETLRRLLAEREPVYSQADLIVDGGGAPPERAVDSILKAVQKLPPHPNPPYVSAQP